MFLKARRAFIASPRTRCLRVLTASSFLFPVIPALFVPTAADACACGCGVFDVGTASLFATSHGGIAFLEYDYMDQNKNWSGTSSAPAANNSDKELRTDFMTAGIEYMFNHDWGVMAEVPYWNRNFATDNGNGVQTFQHAALGDVRLRGVYTGFSDDMTTGVEFGVKLPTGDFKYANFDRDTEIGTGSTDLLLGGYHFGGLTDDNSWVWFGQVNLDLPFATQGGYRPGAEVNAAVGIYYNDLTIGDDIKLAPVLQLIVSHRASDSGPAAHPEDSGYDRVLLAPGVEFDLDDWKLFANVAFPVYQDVRGNQLVASTLLKVTASYAF
jgi:hypothetical protein